MSDNVVHIGDLRIRQREKLMGLRDDRCLHNNTTWDRNGDIITCDDCKKQISPVWMLKTVMAHYDKAMRRVAERERALADDKSHNLHLVAAKKVEEIWRTRTMAPCCPHCDRGILPQDQLGATQIRKDFEIRRRKAKPTEGKPGLYRG